MSRIAGLAWLILVASSSVVAAQQKSVPPPAQWADYFAAVRKADESQPDLEQRCRAYPDLPDADWAPGAGKARCPLLRPPAYMLPQMEALLDRDDGAAQLDRRFAELLDAHYADPEQRDQIFIAYFQFDASSQAERVAQRWRTASPDSVYAKTAQGAVFTAQGWRARGSDYMKDTSAEKLEKMRERFVEAVVLLSEALKQEPRMLPACTRLAAIGRMSSDKLQQGALAVCLKADPDSYFVVDEMATAAEPKWGGSAEAMRAVDAYALAHAQNNPMLHVLTVSGIGYEADNGGDWDRKLTDMLPGARRAPNANYLREVGTAYVAKNEDWKALVYLSQALRFMPHYVEQARLRAAVLTGLGYPEWALGDARRAVEAAPGNGRAQFVLAGALYDLDRFAEARAHYQRAMGDPDVRDAAFASYCRTFLTQKDYGQADACTAELVQEFPENGEAWNLRAWLLDAKSDPRLRRAADEFLKYQNPERWPDHARVAAELQKRFGGSAKR